MKNLHRILRRNKQGNQAAYNGFIYPEAGQLVECTDWKNTLECGNGLHGWDSNNWEHFDSGNKGNYVVIDVIVDEGFVELGDKIKFNKGYIVYNGISLEKAKEYMFERYKSFIFHDDCLTAGNRSTLTAGDRSTLTAGDYSNLTAGNRSTLTAGNRSTLTAGDRSTLTAGDYSNLTAGDSSNLTAGNYSNLTAGDSSFINLRLYYGRALVKVPSNCIVSISIINRLNSSLKYYTNLLSGTTYLFDSYGEIIKKYDSTNDQITKLDSYEIFVFGSNKAGNHIGGAAKFAKDNFGAQNGIGEGLIGNCYAFPTLNENLDKLTIKELESSVNKLFDCAIQNTDNIFLLTKVGCGIAGYDEEFMKSLFVNSPVNIIKPLNW